MFWACVYVCPRLCGRFIRHWVKWVRARKQGLVVNCTAIFLYHPVLLLSLNCSLPPVFLNLLLLCTPSVFNISPSASFAHSCYSSCSFCLSFCFFKKKKSNLKKKKVPFFNCLIPNFSWWFLLLPLHLPLRPLIPQSFSYHFIQFFSSACFLPFCLSLTISNSFYPYLALLSGCYHLAIITSLSPVFFHLLPSIYSLSSQSVPFSFHSWLQICLIKKVPTSHFWSE